MLTIHLKKKHFTTDDFISGNACPIANALKERYKTDNVLVGFHYAYVEAERRFLRKPYLGTNFRADQKVAAKAKSPEDIIRTVVFL